MEHKSLRPGFRANLIASRKTTGHEARLSGHGAHIDLLPTWQQQRASLAEPEQFDIDPSSAYR
ncbi:hypothetical protein AB4Y38_39900 [Paraburkholderia sp. EG285A]